MENKLQIRHHIVSVVRLGNVQLQANSELVVLASIFAVDQADVVVNFSFSFMLHFLFSFYNFSFQFHFIILVFNFS
jgi:hypothetical protein